MQTFLPYSCFQASARVLDNGRLGNQCYRECKTLVGGHWENHPASKMWRGHERSLCEYALALVDEMGRRGRWKPEVIERWREYFSQLRDGFPETGLPAWVGDEEFHAAHRSNLLRKDPVWYGQFGWTEPPDLPYVWPVGLARRSQIEFVPLENLGIQKWTRGFVERGRRWIR